MGAAFALFLAPQAFADDAQLDRGDLLMAKPLSPLGANPCNPCAGKNPCNPCNPCAVKNPCKTTY